jgi:hypothetical protein
MSEPGNDLEINVGDHLVAISEEQGAEVRRLRAVLTPSEENVAFVAGFFDRYYQDERSPSHWLDSCGPSVDLLRALSERAGLRENEGSYETDGRLIAAASELLELLKLALSWAGPCNATCVTVPCVPERIRQLIDRIEQPPQGDTEGGGGGRG